MNFIVVLCFLVPAVLLVSASIFSISDVSDDDSFEILRFKCSESAQQINEELRKASTGANTFASILMPLMNNLSYVNYAITAALGGMLAVKGFMTPGGIVAFLTNSRNFSQPITQVSQQFNNAIAAIAGAERIFEYIDEKPEVDDGYVTLVNAKFDENGELCECEEHTGVWAWKHQHTADGTVTYKQLKGDVVFENVTFS